LEIPAIYIKRIRDVPQNKEEIMKSTRKLLLSFIGITALLLTSTIVSSAHAMVEPYFAKVYYQDADTDTDSDGSYDFDADSNCAGYNRTCYGFHGILHDNVMEIQMRIDRDGNGMYDEKCYYYDWDSAYNWVLVYAEGCIQWGVYTWWYEAYDVNNWDYSSNNWDWYMAYAYKISSGSSWEYIWTYID
jgi:hypothetical protein